MSPKQIPQKLMLIGFLNGLCFYAPVALLIRTQNGISISQFFILQMILSIGIFLTEIPAGYLSDHIGYKNTMLLIARFLLLHPYFIGFIFHCFLWTLRTGQSAQSSADALDPVAALCFEHTQQRSHQRKHRSSWTL